MALGARVADGAVRRAAAAASSGGHPPGAPPPRIRIERRGKETRARAEVDRPAVACEDEVRPASGAGAAASAATASGPPAVLRSGRNARQLALSTLTM